jgi:hypothetical protein
MRWNPQGIRIELASVPNSGQSRIATTQRSGNPRHDTRSGKFGQGGGGRQRPLPNENVDRLSYARMLDAVRNAARSLGDLSSGTVEQFIKDHAQAPDQVDLGQFLQQVLDQRKTDMIDLLDHQISGGGQKSPVRLISSGGQITQMLGQMQDTDIQEVHDRLLALGHTEDEINKAIGREDSVGPPKPKGQA